MCGEGGERRGTKCNAVLLQAIQILKGIACLSTRSGDFRWVSQHTFTPTRPSCQHQCINSERVGIGCTLV